jgi:hypothetical protein
VSDTDGRDQEQQAVEQLVEQALDVFVYAPIGLLFEGRSLLPQLVEKGKNQVTMARMVGQFAVQQGSVEAAKAASKLQDQAAGVLELLGLVGDDAPPSQPTPAAPPEPPRLVPDPPVDSPSVATAPDPSELAIPDYDGLSASQVVNRLAGLTEEELESVAAYESAHRGRKTILNKVAQLQG